MSNNKPNFVQRIIEIEKALAGIMGVLTEFTNSTNAIKQEILLLNEQLESIYKLSENNEKITLKSVESDIVQKRITNIENTIKNLLDKGEIVETEEIKEDSLILIEAEKANIARTIQRVSLISDTDIKNRLIGKNKGYTDSETGLIVHRVFEIIENKPKSE